MGMPRPADTGDDVATATAATRTAAGGVMADTPMTGTPVTAIEPHVARRTPPVPSLAVAGRVDRFLLLEKLGEGGMGAVYAAYDSLLDRKVAMKVVRPDRRGHAGGVSARDRLLREAQAMARLSHPNVVAVLEVGELGDDVYLALELVEGSTMKAWLRAARRPWRQIVAAFVAAGRGLAAAHAAGLVHRDFKPDNVLIGTDGRIRVADFGVVSMSHGQRESSSQLSQDSEPEPADDPGAVGDPFTFTGMRVGTPAYMAPEQYAAGSIDARADQFSFCVALWEALYGERPFAPLTQTMTAESFRDRPVRPPRPDPDVPAWIEPLLRRGLSADAAARWPSMEPLIAELARDRLQARRRLLAMAGIGAMVAVTAALAFAGWTRDRAAPTPPCRDEGRHLAGVWDPARASALERSFQATGAPTADSVVARVRDHLDGWSKDWVAMRTEACAATRIHGDQSEALLDARMRCLDRRLARVGALVTELAAVEREGLGRAVEIAVDLPPLDACADPEQLTAAAPPPDDPAVRARVDVIERELERITAIERTGHYPAALAALVPVVADATAAGHVPTLAEALSIRGRLEAQTGAIDAAAATLREASALAARVHADDVVADVLIELVWVLSDQGKASDALALAAGAEAAAVRVHDRRQEATLAAHVGGAHSIAGDADTAVRELERALRLTEVSFGAHHVRVAQVLNRLGNAEAQRGRVAEARVHYERALVIAEAEVGSEHPSVAVTRANLCYLDATAGRLEEARVCQERVVATLEAALGSEHPQVAWALNDLGLVEQSRDNQSAARARFERAQAIWEKSSGPDHPDVAWPLVNLAELARQRGDVDAAERLCRRALTIVEAASGADHPDAMSPLACLGGVIAERRPAEARPLLERALALAAATHDGASTGVIRFALARAALAARERSAAAAHGRAALEALDAAGPDAARDRREVNDWLKRQRL